MDRETASVRLVPDNIAHNKKVPDYDERDVLATNTNLHYENGGLRLSREIVSTDSVEKQTFFPRIHSNINNLC